MSRDIGQLDEQIERLRGGGTLSENEVRALCETVRWGYPRLHCFFLFFFFVVRVLK